MTVFRAFEFQISPRPSIYLFASEADESFCEALELAESSEISCHIMAVEDANAQMSAFNIAIGEKFSGFATLNRSYDKSDLTLAVSQRQFKLLTDVLLSSSKLPKIVSVRVSVSNDFAIVNHKRIYKVEGAPMVSVSNEGK